MAKLEVLLARIKSRPTDYTVRELNTLMAKCGCKVGHGGRGSSLQYYHMETGRMLTFDGPHPGNTLYRYQVKDVLNFLSEIGVD